MNISMPEDTDLIHTINHAHKHPHAHDEEHLREGLTRRSFLKAAGFTLAAMTVACERPQKNVLVPHKRLSPEATPGKPVWYASTCGGCAAACGILVKNRDGRPIKIEGNPEHPVSRGGLCAVGQASLLELYDSHRLRGPQWNGKETKWSEIDQRFIAEFESVRESDKTIWLVTNTLHGPADRDAIAAFSGKYANVRHVAYDALSVSALLDAHEAAFGKRSIPRYRFQDANLIVSFDADFLGTWISPVEFTRGYSEARASRLEQHEMARHVQLESRVSITGSKADQRHALTPAGIDAALRYAHAAIAAKLGRIVSLPAVDTAFRPKADALVEELWKNRGKSIVVCGVNDTALQHLCVDLNVMLGGYGATMDIRSASSQRQGNDAQLAEFIDAARQGKVAAIVFHGVNPLYDLPGRTGLREALARVPLVVSTSPYEDETGEAAPVLAPVPHYLEEWSDGEPVAGVHTLYQPVIEKLRNTRSFAESLSAWCGTAATAHDLVRNALQRRATQAGAEFELFWRESVQRGFVQSDVTGNAAPQYAGPDAKALSSQGRQKHSDWQAVLYPKAAMLDGSHSNNPWLHELPDPITKVTWDNYACISAEDAEHIGIREGDVLRVSGNGLNNTIEIPAYIQEGQATGVIALAVGYGKKGTERFRKIGPQWLESKDSVGANGRVGVRVNDLSALEGTALRNTTGGWKVEKTGRTLELAKSQKYDFITEPELTGKKGEEARECLQETTLTALIHGHVGHGKGEHAYGSMWSGYDYKGHHWGMAIDLTACTGCSACVVACQAENNIPVVGKDEVRRHRFMHWIRIDRYYKKTPDGLHVAHQPMMCHHCDNAPCETVCPVLATAHSEEGLNQQVYNRCVGTRYCSNNCPYKIRRFNWFEYKREDEMANLVLNPDVTVRERGVMEKCSFCIQRIQAAKIQAKAEGRPVSDGEILPACAQSCPANAIVFGDMNDPKSKLVKMMSDPRHYRAIEEVGTLPSVGYLSLVRNTGGKEV